MSTVISVENVSKIYRLGQIGAGTLKEDFARWSAKLRGKPDSLVKVGQEHHARHMGEEFWALEDVSFEVKEGEVVGVVGRNGAGKSTLLKILSQVTTPTSGHVRIKGRIASLLEVGTGFHPELTGRENVFLNGAILGMTKSEIRSKFDEIVAFSGVEEFLDTPVKRYSSGMYVRLAFAVAAHLEPEILIVDEVLAVGDFEFQKKCLGKMQDVASGGRTVIFVSHNLSSVRNLCSRALLLDKGRLTFAGGSAETIEQYSQHGLLRAGMVWDRPSVVPRSRISFQSIRVNLIGKHPQLRLECNLELCSVGDSEAVFICVDICDCSLTPIMQAMPLAEPFIDGKDGSRHLILEIDLPALIPGLYALDFWIGTHYSKTIDYVKNVASFEVTESPTDGRSFPHTRDHGFLVPSSRCFFAKHEH